MAWQDITITICIIALNYALIPQIILGFKKKKALMSTQTAIIFSISTAILTLAYLTLKLYLASTMNGVATVLWTTILIQSVIYKKIIISDY